MLIQVGDKIDRFHIQQHIAQGGAASIFLALDQMTGKQVALKIPSQLSVGIPAPLERFRRELEVMKTLDHPYIQKGVMSGQFNQMPYLVTEWVNGRSMRDIVDEQAPMAPDKAIDIIRKLAEGMKYCHANGVIHRDLKPENVLIQADGQPMILDFGLALTKDAKRVTYANSTMMVGTPEYMSPEQCEGQRGGIRSDIYALGVMLYELLAGKTPFAGKTIMVVMAGHLQREVPQLDRKVPGLSPQLAAVVTKALQKNPDDRYANMDAFIEALDQPDLSTVIPLDQTAGTVRKSPRWWSYGFMAVSLSLVTLISILAIALGT
ncbi:MAG: serine/threonine protein kinase [Anaerolineae bacterium]|nr:serine/threonine protein kinase [Anaerolineae bacterium]